MGEAALHQQVGSAEVMDERFRSLAWVAKGTGSATLQILPSSPVPMLQLGTGRWRSCM
jgi:hypothetical protein